MNVPRLVDSIAYIPHLDLGKEFDVEKMRAEFLNLSIDTLQPYRSSTPQIADMIAQNWHGASLFSPDGSVHGDLTENPKNYISQCKPTALAERCPYMVSIVDELGGQDAENYLGTRARIMMVKPKGKLTWHSHQFDGVEAFRPWITVVHIPIFSPFEFRYSVIPIGDFRLGDHANEKMKIYTENYPVGRATMFNCVHMHNVFNDSENAARISLMLYLDLNNPKTYDIVDRAVANYTGEWIDR